MAAAAGSWGPDAFRDAGTAPAGDPDDEAPAHCCAPGLFALAEMGRFELPRGFHPNLLSREAH